MKKLGLALLATAALSLAAAPSAEARSFGGFHGGGVGGFRGGDVGFRSAGHGYGGPGWGWRRGGWGGFGAGLIAGSVLGATDAYAYPYYYAYPHYYGYPAYGYYTYSNPAYSYPAQRVVVVRQPRRVVNAHEVRRAASASRDRIGSTHARSTPVHRVGTVHAG